MPISPSRAFLVVLLVTSLLFVHVMSVNVAAEGQVSVAITTAELQQLAKQNIPPLIAASGITGPNQIIGEFNVLDQHYVNPTLVLDGPPTVHLSSQPGQDAVVDIYQAVHLEAEKKEARFRHNIWPLTHAGDMETVDAHQRLVAGSVHLTATVEVKGVPGALNTLQPVVHYSAKPVELQPEIDLGQAIPIPGIRDVIQHLFVDKLNSVEGKQDTVEISQFKDKVAALDSALQSAQVQSLAVVTADNADGLVIRVSGSGEMKHEL